MFVIDKEFIALNIKQINVSKTLIKLYSLHPNKVNNENITPKIAIHIKYNKLNCFHGILWEYNDPIINPDIDPIYKDIIFTAKFLTPKY